MASTLPVMTLPSYRSRPLPPTPRHNSMAYSSPPPTPTRPNGPAMPPRPPLSASGTARQMTTNPALDLDEYLRLSNGIRALEYVECEAAPTAERVQQQQHRLKSATKELEMAQTRCVALLSKIRKLRRPSISRVKHRLTGDFTETLDKKEREYQTMLAAKEDRERNVNTLQNELDELVNKLERFDSDKRQLGKLRNELNQFVERSFTGPTPGCPEEDTLESELSIMAANYFTLRDLVMRDSAVHAHLQAARSSLADALSAVVAQLQREESIGVFGAFSTYGYMQSSHMRASRQCLADACFRQAQARALDPLVPETISYDLLEFENDLITSLASLLSGDLFMQDRIKRLYTALMMVVGQLDRVLADHGQRASAMNQHAHQVYVQLEAKRKELTEFRIGIFERSLQEGEQPPGYQE